MLVVVFGGDGEGVVVVVVFYLVVECFELFCCDVD